MPVPAHTRVSLLGRLGDIGSGAPEIWSTSFAINQDVTTEAKFIDKDPAKGAADSLLGCVKALWGSADFNRSVYANLDAVKVAHIGADGRYTGPPVLLPYPQPGPGRQGGVQYPPQVAQVFTLDCLVYGRSPGRMYFPAPGAGLNGQYQMATDVVDGHVLALATFFSQVNALKAGASCVVMSGKGPGYNTIDQVRSGRVLDTMRSRRNALDEAYRLLRVPGR